MVEQILVVVGAGFLVIGPALQALAELREYRELVLALESSQLPDVVEDSFEALIGVNAITRSWFILPWVIADVVRVLPRYRTAFKAFSAAAVAGDENATRIRAGLARARNWCIVLVGAVLIFAAAVIHLINS